MHSKHLLTGAMVAVLSLTTLFSNSAFAAAVTVGEAPGGAVSETTSAKRTTSAAFSPAAGSVEQKIVKANALPNETTAAKEETQAATEAQKESTAAVQTTSKATTAAETMTRVAETTTKAATVATTTVKETVASSTAAASESAAEDPTKSTLDIVGGVRDKKEEKGPGIKLLKKETTAIATTEETTKAETPSDKLRREVVEFGKKYIGLRYIWGGANLEQGVDCSGLIQQIYKNFGIATGRTSRDQAARGREIPISEIKPGDLLIYDNGANYINHVTMYIGDNKLLNGSSEETGVIISDIGYRTPIKAVRFIEDSTALAANE